MARTTNDFTALARLWKDRRSSVALVYERRMGEDPGPTLQRWVDWVRSTYPEQVGINGVTRMTASQWLLTFSSIDSRELFVELLRALAETADLSATGRLRPLRQTRPTEAVLNTPWMNTTVVISLPLTSGWSNTPRGRRGGRLLEFVKDESISELLAFAGRWVSAVAPEPHVVTMGVEFPVDAGSVEEVLQALWSTREDAIVILADGRPDRARALHITDSAQCILQWSSSDSADAPTAALDEAQAMLRALAGFCTYGFALRTPYVRTIVLDVLEPAWPPRPGFLLGRIGRLPGIEETSLPDVFPVQYLGGGFKDPLPADVFDTEWLPGGGRLVTHRRAEAWLAAAAPPPAEELDAARRAAGRMLGLPPD